MITGLTKEMRDKAANVQQPMYLWHTNLQLSRSVESELDPELTSSPHRPMDSGGKARSDNPVTAVVLSPHSLS